MTKVKIPQTPKSQHPGVSHYSEIQKRIHAKPEEPKPPTKFTFTPEEFERLGLLRLSVFDLAKSLDTIVTGNGEGLVNCLGMVASELDNLVCDVEQRMEGGAQ